jgi:hypothetical protein
MIEATSEDAITAIEILTDVAVAGIWKDVQECWTDPAGDTFHAEVIAASMKLEETGIGIDAAIRIMQFIDRAIVNAPTS